MREFTFKITIIPVERREKEEQSSKTVYQMEIKCALIFLTQRPNLAQIIIYLFLFHLEENKKLYIWLKIIQHNKDSLQDIVWTK